MNSPTPTQVALDYLNKQGLPDADRDKVIQLATYNASIAGHNCVLLHDVHDALVALGFVKEKLT